MSNICIFTNSLMSGGAEKQAILLARALSRDYKVWLVVYFGEQTTTGYTQLVEEYQINAVYLKGNHIKRIHQFIRFLRGKSIDIIFSYLLTTNFVGGLLGKALGIKYTFGGIRSSRLDKKKIPIQRFLQNYINYKTIYNNYCGFEYFAEKGFKTEKGLIIPNCFELKTDVNIRQPQTELTITAVGRFHPAKDYLTAIKAVAKLRESTQNFVFNIIGYGDLEGEIRGWIAQHNATEYIDVILDPPDLDDHYLNTDIFLQTSVFEGMSNTVLEAMNHTLPLVVTDVGDNGRMVTHQKTGYLLQPKHIDDISAALLALCQSYEKRIQFGKRGYDFLKNNFSADLFKQRYMRIIQELK